VSKPPPEKNPPSAFSHSPVAGIYDLGGLCVTSPKIMLAVMGIPSDGSTLRPSV
jgi:hypothetical protein